MTSKMKRFGSGSPLVKGIVDTVRGGTSEEQEFNVELVKLERIAPDPLNPRLLGLTEEELSWLKNDIAVEEARTGDNSLEARTKTLLKLRDLSDSIKSNGVLQPIRIYRYGDGFRIESGERRYWGSLIADQQNIQAIILPEKTKRLRTAQLIENLQRDDLSLAARLRNVASVIEELETEKDGKAVTGVDLAEVIGTSRRQGAKYLSVVRAHEDIMSAITTGAIDNLDTAEELSKIDDDKQRIAAIKAYSSGLSKAEVKQTISKKPTKKASRAGRPAVQIKLGATKNCDLVKLLMEKAGAEKEAMSIDWSDYKVVADTWSHFLKNLEKTL